jgi:hypothetical protein
MAHPKITLVGGPTALIEAGGFRLLTDPTFDPPGAYRLPHVTLTKTAGPSLPVAAVEPIDAVLLSHDQHADNLDHSGRAFLATAPRVLTTVVGARRLEGGAQALPGRARRLRSPVETRCTSPPRLPATDRPASNHSPAT